MHNDSDDDLRDDEFPDEDDADDGSTTTCPECGAEIYDDTPRCPHCGSYLPADVGQRSGGPAWWIVLGVAVALAAIAMWFIR
jgi:hypothetical protein